jgi:putative addiction module killer protein
MAVDMVLNDLSFPFPSNERGVARQLMTDFIGVLSTAKIYGVKTLRTQCNLYDLILSPDYPMSSWLNDRQVEREERSFFLRELDTKTPLLAEITDTTIRQEEGLSDFKYQGELAYALGIAYLLNALVVSFNSEPKWDCASLVLEITRLENSVSSEDVTAELTLMTLTESLIHASRREHVLGHKTQIQTLLRAVPWHPKEELLPCYVTAEGKKPIGTWLESLDDLRAKEFIQARLNQLKQGLLGDAKSVGEGVFELRIFYGPAYRVYFGQTAPGRQLLLCGGEKSTQVQDIIKAKQYWQDYKQR